MENMITVFENEEFGAVRTTVIDDMPWFVGRDVAKILGHTNPLRAIRDYVEDDDKGVTEIVTPGGVQKITVINESGLYALIMSSHIPSAKRFKHWVTSEVIPSIRRYGMYATTPMLRKFQENPELIQLVCERMLAEKDRADRLDKKVAELQPKADFFDAFVNPEDCTNIRSTAKELGVPERMLCKFLQDAGFLYRCPAGYLMPYSKPENEGLFIVRDYYT
jgi:prophage antirepressor-like protein